MAGWWRRLRYTAMDRASAGRIVELDGLRGVAILLVLICHLGAGASPADRRMFEWWNGGAGGFIGVQLFFVLSGYLITGVLLREHAGNRSINLGAFYVRRIRRLVPALVLVCLGYIIFSITWSHHMKESLGATGRALTYTTNLTFLDRYLPDASWLGHTWSLAVEEQFYLFWPILLLFALRRGRSTVTTVALIGAAITIALRWIFPQSDMYNLLRWDALLLGCAVAASPIRIPRFAGWVGWGVISVYSVAKRLTPLDYTVASLACTMVLVTSLDNRLLRNRVLCWFGTISYGLYLWHVIILRLGPPALLGASISIGIAAASYYLVERRFLRARPLAPESPSEPPLTTRDDSGLPTAIPQVDEKQPPH